mmetsp:Transcript_24504/g.79108  ORF Transcript_24504/g.79108 Transcript_24504/m.79108 type:complete len:233 (-) Transcript_24504:1080-1778(-)
MTGMMFRLSMVHCTRPAVGWPGPRTPGRRHLHLLPSLPSPSLTRRSTVQRRTMQSGAPDGWGAGRCPKCSMAEPGRLRLRTRQIRLRCARRVRLRLQPRCAPPPRMSRPPLRGPAGRGVRRRHPSTTLAPTAAMLVRPPKRMSSARRPPRRRARLSRPSPRAMTTWTRTSMTTWSPGRSDNGRAHSLRRAGPGGTPAVRGGAQGVDQPVGARAPPAGLRRRARLHQSSWPTL